MEQSKYEVKEESNGCFDWLCCKTKKKPAQSKGSIKYRRRRKYSGDGDDVYEYYVDDSNDYYVDDGNDNYDDNSTSLNKSTLLSSNQDDEYKYRYDSAPETINPHQEIDTRNNDRHCHTNDNSTNHSNSYHHSSSNDHGTSHSNSHHHSSSHDHSSSTHIDTSNDYCYSGGGHDSGGGDSGGGDCGGGDSGGGGGDSGGGDSGGGGCDD